MAGVGVLVEVAGVVDFFGIFFREEVDVEGTVSLLSGVNVGVEDGIGVDVGVGVVVGEEVDVGGTICHLAWVGGDIEVEVVLAVGLGGGFGVDVGVDVQFEVWDWLINVCIDFGKQAEFVFFT